MDIEKYLEELAEEERPVKHSGLLQLSGLSAEEMSVFKRAWASFPVERRHEVLTKLLDMAEDNVDLDFNSVLRFCLGDENEAVRGKAVLGLWECDDRSLIISLTSLLKEDPSESVRAASAVALGKFASLAQEGKLLAKDGERIRDALLEVIEKDTESTEVKRRAIESVAPFNTPEVSKIIDEAYNSDIHGVRQSSLYAMGKSCDPSWLPVIIKELDSDDLAMRFEAANACAEMGEEAAVPHLIELLEEDDPQIQLAAIHAMGAMGGALARRALQVCLRSEDDSLGEAAREALKDIEFTDDSLTFRYEV